MPILPVLMAGFIALNQVMRAIQNSPSFELVTKVYQNILQARQRQARLEHQQFEERKQEGLQEQTLKAQQAAGEKIAELAEQQQRTYELLQQIASQQQPAASEGSLDDPERVPQSNMGYQRESLAERRNDKQAAEQKLLPPPQTQRVPNDDMAVVLFGANRGANDRAFTPPTPYQNDLTDEDIVSASLEVQKRQSARLKEIEDEIRRESASAQRPASSVFASDEATIRVASDLINQEATLVIPLCVGVSPQQRVTFYAAADQCADLYNAAAKSTGPVHGAQRRAGERARSAKLMLVATRLIRPSYAEHELTLNAIREIWERFQLAPTICLQLDATGQELVVRAWFWLAGDTLPTHMVTSLGLVELESLNDPLRGVQLTLSLLMLLIGDDISLEGGEGVSALLPTLRNLNAIIARAQADQDPQRPHARQPQTGNTGPVEPEKEMENYPALIPWIADMSRTNGALYGSAGLVNVPTVELDGAQPHLSAFMEDLAQLMGRVRGALFASSDQREQYRPWDRSLILGEWFLLPVEHTMCQTNQRIWFVLALKGDSLEDMVAYCWRVKDRTLTDGRQLADAGARALRATPRQFALVDAGPSLNRLSQAICQTT